jgi:hypothetical protein
MTLTANTSALLYGSPLQSPADPPRPKKTSTHIRGDEVLVPTCMAVHMLAYTRADRLCREKSAVPNCFGLSSAPNCPNQFARNTSTTQPRPLVTSGMLSLRLCSSRSIPQQSYSGPWLRSTPRTVRQPLVEQLIACTCIFLFES